MSEAFLKLEGFTNIDKFEYEITNEQRWKHMQPTEVYQKTVG